MFEIMIVGNGSKDWGNFVCLKSNMLIEVLRVVRKILSKGR